MAAKPLMVYINPFLMRRIKKASKITSKPMSQLARDAISKEIDGYALEYPELAAKNFRPARPKKKAA